MARLKGPHVFTKSQMGHYDCKRVSTRFPSLFTGHAIKQTYSQ